MSKLILDSPDNINELSDAELLELCPDVLETKYSKVKRLQIIRDIYGALGYELTNDIILTLMTNTERTLVLALAGGGKTTTMVIKVILWQIMNPERPASEYLFLVFNKANTEDIIRTHKKISNILNNKLGYKIEEGIKAKTIHGLARDWIQTTKDINKFGYNSELLADGNRLELLVSKVVDNWCYNKMKAFDRSSYTEKKLKAEIKKLLGSTQDIIALYNLAIETMKPLEELQHTDPFTKIGLSVEDTKSLLGDMRATLRKNSVFVFSEAVEELRDLLRDNKSVRDRLHYNFKVVIVDEFQDLSLIMIDLLKYLVPPKCPMVAIGDDDQSIYKFRGVSQDNTINFREIYKTEFSTPTVLSLNLNRRCPKNIVEFGKNILELNGDRRYNKVMNSTGRVGKISIKRYSNAIGEAHNIVEQLERLHNSGEDSVIVAYRNKASSAIVVDLMKDKGIPFHVDSGEGIYGDKFYNVLSHRYYTVVKNILNTCLVPRKPSGHLELHNCLPITKSQLYVILDYNPATRTFDGDTNVLTQLRIEKVNSKNLKEAYEKFVNIVIAVKERKPLNTYIDSLMDLVSKYCFLPNDANKYYFFNAVKEYYSSDKTWSEFLTEDAELKAEHKYWKENNKGVKFTTFHSLKGLEFNEVILMDLSEDIFPGEMPTDKIISKEEMIEENDENNRLFYVAITRTKNNLTMYFNKSTPSRYISIAEKYDKEDLVDSVIKVSRRHGIDCNLEYLRFIDSYVESNGELKIEMNTCVEKVINKNKVQEKEQVVQKEVTGFKREDNVIKEVSSTIEEVSSPIEEVGVTVGKRFTRRKSGKSLVDRFS